MLPAAAQVYKCPGPDGKPVFQQTGCVDGQKMDVRPASGEGGSDLGRELRAATKAYKEAVQARTEACKQRIKETKGELSLVIGMPKDDALCNPGWMFPDKVNTTQTADGVQEQYVYRIGPGNTKYLYFTDGKLTAIQE